VSDLGPNYSKYSYDQWPVRLPEDPKNTPVHVGRTVNGTDYWTTRDVAAKQLEWVEREILQGEKPLPPEEQARREQMWLQHYREGCCTSTNEGA
jgi:hypothetical protein